MIDNPNKEHMMTLGNKLQEIVNLAESEKRAANEKTRQIIARKVAEVLGKKTSLISRIETTFNNDINDGKIPVVKVTDSMLSDWMKGVVREHRYYATRDVVPDAELDRAIWVDMVARFALADIEVAVNYAHDGVGEKSWYEVTVVLPKPTI
jgi:hypothetical protein